jgi:hypothetical protein
MLAHFLLSYSISPTIEHKRNKREIVMSSPENVSAPGGFVPRYALSFGSANAAAVAVDASNPLPVADTRSAGPAASTPLGDSLAASGTSAAFAPQLGRPIWLTLGGSWSGTASLLRSTDGGVTRLPLTYADGSAKPVWTGNMQAPVAEESVAGALYYLSVALTAGTITFRMEQ